MKHCQEKIPTNPTKNSIISTGVASNLSSVNLAFSYRAHDAAIRLLYPKLFNTADFRLMDCFGNGWDCRYGIDWLGEVRLGGAWVSFSVQERFRRLRFCRYRELTMTDFHASGCPGESHHLLAQWMVYGYYEEERDDFVEAVVVSIPALWRAWSVGAVEVRRGRVNQRTSQTFLQVSFDDLRGAGLVAVHYVGCLPF